MMKGYGSSSFTTMYPSASEDRLGVMGFDDVSRGVLTTLPTLCPVLSVRLTSKQYRVELSPAGACGFFWYWVMLALHSPLSYRFSRLDCGGSVAPRLGPAAAQRPIAKVKRTMAVK